MKLPLDETPACCSPALETVAADDDDEDDEDEDEDEVCCGGCEGVLEAISSSIVSCC